MRRQLKQTKFKNAQAKTKHSGGGTRRSYSLSLWHLNNWLHGKTIEISKVIPVGKNLHKVDTVIMQLDTVEDLLKAYQESNDKGMTVIHTIKEYLMDSDQHANKSRGYMDNIVSSIKAYFNRNETPISISFNTNIDHDDISEILSDTPSTLSLQDLMELITTGKPSIVEKAVVLCKFHSGLDNSTFSDRFNFEAFPQLVKWFGTDKHNEWDLEKCPVIINLTRIKIGFPHICCLDKDAISALQKALDWREKKKESVMKIGQAIFINTKLNPITNRWISDLIPKLAEKCGIQNSFKIKSGIKNEKTSHELRDLLKSTLISCGASAYATNHLIGHMPRDSYEKEAILYPKKIRVEYMKASSTLNVLTGFTKYISGDTEKDALQKQMKEMQERHEFELSRNRDDVARIVKAEMDSYYAELDKRMSKTVKTLIDEGKKSDDEFIKKKLTPKE